jgi:hypothetical protein
VARFVCLYGFCDGQCTVGYRDLGGVEGAARSCWRTSGAVRFVVQVLNPRGSARGFGWLDRRGMVGDVACLALAPRSSMLIERTRLWLSTWDVPRFRRALEAKETARPDQLDASVLDDLFVDDVVSHDAASGKEEVIDRWRGWAGEGTSAEAGGVYADDLHSVATVELSGGRGNTVEQALIFHLDDGKVTEFWSLPTEAAVVAALVSGEDVPAHPYMEVFETAEATRERNTFELDDIANICAFLREDVVTWTRRPLTF